MPAWMISTVQRVQGCTTPNQAAVICRAEVEGASFEADADARGIEDHIHLGMDDQAQLGVTVVEPVWRVRDAAGEPIKSGGSDLTVGADDDGTHPRRRIFGHPRIVEREL